MRLPFHVPERRGEEGRSEAHRVALLSLEAARSVHLEPEEEHDTDDDERAEHQLVTLHGPPEHERLEERGEERDRREAEHRNRHARELHGTVEEHPVEGDEHPCPAELRRAPPRHREGHATAQSTAAMSTVTIVTR